MQQSKLNPYISFNTNAREAMEFYKSVFGGTLETTTFKEGGVPCDPSEENMLMHSQLIADNGINLMGADSPASMGEPSKTSNISMALSGENEDELTAYYNKLAEGGKVREPLKKAPWGDTFGMVTDKYGVEWMFNILMPKTEEK